MQPIVAKRDCVSSGVEVRGHEVSKIRLICPNCGAQYEVPAEVVPDEGRDVQCSNCAHTWFQRHPDHDPDLAEDLNQPVPDTAWEPEEPPAAPPPPSVEEPATETPPPAPRGIDPEMAELFREEREYEANQRVADALESQPDLGLQEPSEDEQARHSREARERMARMRGEGPAAAPAPPPPVAAPEPEPETDRESAVAQAAAAAAAGSRRDLLPDVEEINQTLRSSSEPRVIDTAPKQVLPPDEPKKKGGFSRGFLTMVFLAAIAVGVYVMAPKISEQLPQAKPYLDGYVTQVDGLRVWLDGQVTALLTTLDGMSSEAESAPDGAEADS